ncbi:MAG: alpha/beta hydrolase [Acidimicrobiaceae bacterium]|nr:alpha/beta hydrolase [Acidimicrobiaceae bacterium]
MPWFESADLTTIHFQDWGRGAPVVFVSGWGLSCEMWQYQMAALVDHGVRTIAYDRRGHGRSDRPGRGYDYDTLSDDLACLLEHLDLRDVTLVGHSMGDGEIVRYLSRHGEHRVSKIVLVAPIGPLPVATDNNPGGINRALIESVRNGWKQDFTAWLDANADAYVGKGLPGCNVSDGLVEWTKRDLMRTSLRAIIDCNRTAVETDRRDDARCVRVPTLIIHGDHDASMPAALSGQVYAELVVGSTFKLYEHAPHGLYLTHHARLASDLLAFRHSGELAA